MGCDCGLEETVLVSDIFVGSDGLERFLSCGLWSVVSDIPGAFSVYIVCTSFFSFCFYIAYRAFCLAFELVNLCVLGSLFSII